MTQTNGMTLPPPEAAQIGGVLVVVHRARGESRREALLRAWNVAGAAEGVWQDPVRVDALSREAAAAVLSGCAYPPRTPPSPPS